MKVNTFLCEVEEQLSILETKLKEHVHVHQLNEQKLQGEIDDMTKELEKVKFLLEEKLDNLGPDELPVNLFPEQTRKDKVSSMFVEVGDLETFDDDLNDQ